jgi:hypothetical protein
MKGEKEKRVLIILGLRSYGPSPLPPLSFLYYNFETWIILFIREKFYQISYDILSIHPSIRSYRKRLS